MDTAPALPRWLGRAGLLPQLACVGVLYAGPAEWREPAMTGRPARHAYRLTQKGMALVQDLARNDPALSGKAVRI